MQQNIVTIEVPASLPEPAQDISVGNMYEHNATALKFVLDEALVSADYQYYLEFVTVSGVSRTEYLTPSEAGEILFSVPQAVTSQMTALCVLNIVQVSADGVTEQLICAQTVRLHFSPLENTEKSLCADYEFTINSLLAAIENDTFKGDKGDKGDAYILTDADKTEIASHVDEAFYGLPLQKQETLGGSGNLTGAAEHAAVQSLAASPQSAALEGVSSVMAAFGQNEIAWLLDSAQYTRFIVASGIYSSVELTLKPDTEYVFVKASSAPAVQTYAYLTVGGQQYWFCHKDYVSNNLAYFTFTTPQSGVCTLTATYVHFSQQAYASVLTGDWLGLGIYEKEKSLVLQTAFSTPIYRVDAQYADAYDFVSGALCRRTEKLHLTADMLSDTQVVPLTAGEKIAYRYVFTLPESAAKKAEGCASGLCSLFPTMEADIADDAAYAQYIEQTGQTEGVWFGGEGVCVVSETPPESLAASLTDNALEVLYAAAERTETLAEPQTLVLPTDTRSYIVEPASICVEIAYSADLSAVVNDFEARLRTLENKI